MRMENLFSGLEERFSDEEGDLLKRHQVPNRKKLDFTKPDSEDDVGVVEEHKMYNFSFRILLLYEINWSLKIQYRFKEKIPDIKESKEETKEFLPPYLEHNLHSHKDPVHDPIIDHKPPLSPKNERQSIYESIDHENMDDELRKTLIKNIIK